MLSDQRVFAWRGHYVHPSPSSTRLSGLRLGVKDLFHIAGLPTAAGNPDWLRTHPVPRQTSPVVEALLAAGAQLIGKTQTDELAYSLNGLNSHYGAPHNPVTPERLPGGSSSGSAVAVAAQEIDIGLGTDTGGSIRVPASYNGLLGIRTSHGIIPSDHMVPLAPAFDTVGWLTRDAQTLQAVGEVLLPPSLSVSARKPWRVSLLLPEMNGAALWTSTHQQWLDSQPVLQVFKPLFVKQAWLARASETFRVLQGYEIWCTHGVWIQQQQPRFAPDIQARFQWCSQLTQDQQQQAEQMRVQLCREIEHWFDQVDLVVMPTTPGPAPLLGADAAWMDAYRRQLMGLTSPAGLARLPQIHLPVLQQQGAPVGVSLLGPHQSDKALLQVATELMNGSLA